MNLGPNNKMRSNKTVRQRKELKNRKDRAEKLYEELSKALNIPRRDTVADMSRVKMGSLNMQAQNHVRYLVKKISRNIS